MESWKRKKGADPEGAPRVAPRTTAERVGGVTRREFLGRVVGGGASLGLSWLASKVAGEYFIPAWEQPERTAAEERELEEFRKRLENRMGELEDAPYAKRLFDKIINHPGRFITDEFERAKRAMQSAGETAKYPVYALHEQLRYTIMFAVFSLTFIMTAGRFQSWAKGILAGRAAHRRDTQIAQAINAHADQLDDLTGKIGALQAKLETLMPTIEALGQAAESDIASTEPMTRQVLEERLAAVEKGLALIQEMRAVEDSLEEQVRNVLNKSGSEGEDE